MTFSTKTAALLDEALQEIYTREDLPGFTALVCRRGETVRSQSYGYADLETGRPAGDRTIYHLGSVTKVFTAIMLMQLREDGRLDLDDPLAKFLPGARKGAWPAVTLRRLASHTAGLPMMPPLESLTEAMQEFPPRLETLESMTFPSMEAILASLPQVGFESNPGERVSYSNLGVALLAHALELAAGQEYALYVENRILAPLGMQQSGFSEKILGHPQAAVCYLPFFSPPAAAPAATKRIGGFTPTGGLWSSAEDMGLLLGFLTGSEDRDGPRVLSGLSLEAMVSRVAALDASRYTGVEAGAGVGIGWFLSQIRGQALAEHGGADPSASAYLGWMPARRLGVFAAANSGQNPPAIAEAGAALLEIMLLDGEGPARVKKQE